MKRILSWVVHALRVFDWPLLLILLLLAALGLTVMHSAVGGTDGRFTEQSRNFAVAFACLWAMALIPLPLLQRLSVPAYALGVALLLGVEFFGETSKGATRWLHLGVVRIQPSEMMKIALPMMLAWYFQRGGAGHHTAASARLAGGLAAHHSGGHFFGARFFGGHLSSRDILVAGLLIAMPFWLIVRQPDLGTALLVFGAGFCALYFAGLTFKLLAPAALITVAGLAALLHFEDVLCAPATDWVILHDYQKQRVCTLLDPAADPLGRGFHTLQAMIAIGAGGLYGKGYMQGTQTHLDFVPERTTDFIFAVYAEEFGLYGAGLLLALYGLLIARGLTIALTARNQYGRLLAGTISGVLFVYVFVNIGMVSGILPVVGVPLPFMSYGGTALMTLGLACGMLMSVRRYRVVRRAVG